MDILHPPLSPTGWYGVDVAGQGPVGWCGVDVAGPTTLTPCKNASPPAHVMPMSVALRFPSSSIRFWEMIGCGRCREPQRRDANGNTGVDSVKFHSSLDRLCRTIAGIALLEATDRKFAH